MPKNNGEKFNSISHLAAAIGTIIGLIFLLRLSKDRVDYIIVSIIYSSSVLFLFTASTVYHYKKKEERGTSILRKIDHIAIYFMIAGSYTAVIYIYFESFKWVIIIAQWTIVTIATPLKFININIGRWLDISLYIIMGWMLLPVIKLVILYMDLITIILLLAGGITYTIGAILYAMEDRTDTEKIFGLHQVFHLFINAAAVLHYLVIFFGLY